MLLNSTKVRKALFNSLIMFFCLITFSFDGQSIFPDFALPTKFQDSYLGHFKRGRANIAADFNLDGKIDYYIGNPSDESYVLINNSTPDRIQFRPGPVLLSGDLAWGGVAFDYDNDGDYDLFISCGANEGIGFDYLFRNDWILNGVVTGRLSFKDVTSTAGVAGPIPGSSPRFNPTFNSKQFLPDNIDLSGDCGGNVSFVFDTVYHKGNYDGPGRPIMTASANAVVADYDQDGDDDLFVNGNIVSNSNPDYPELIGRNTLYRNNSDGTFTDVTFEAGLAGSLLPTRNSTFLDYDNDGDADLYENNLNYQNILWRNNGDGTFTDVTASVSTNNDISYPHSSFGSGASDINNDGWEDIIAFMRTNTDDGSPYAPGHAVFLNRFGNQFFNAAAEMGINLGYESIGANGVMGCMVGDLNGDGVPDFYIGNGGPGSGTADKLFMSSAGSFEMSIPTYDDYTSYIDYPSNIPAGLPVPPYPYRTHGVNFTDVNDDGILDITVVNGGTASAGDSVQEPNRLFMLNSLVTYNYFIVQPVGDGVSVSKDAIGTRFALTISDRERYVRTIYRTLFGGSCFSAQNGFYVHFGLGSADTIEELKITWPDGTVSIINTGLLVNTKNVVNYLAGNNVLLNKDPNSNIENGELSYALNQNYPNPFNPSTIIKYQVPAEGEVQLIIYDGLGKQVASLVNQVQSPGSYEINFDAKYLSSGIYFYQLRAGSFNQIKKMILLK